MSMVWAAKKKEYRVELTNGERLHTLYTGGSRDRAATAGDTARAVTVITGGTGEITLYENNVADVTWSVNKGEAFLALIGGASK